MKSVKERFASVKGSIEMEGIVISKEIEELVLKEAEGEISFADFLKRMREVAREQ